MYIEPLKFLLWTIACVAFVAVALFFIGRAYEASKTKDELKRLRNWKEATKGLCEKLKDGNDQGDYLPVDLSKFKRAKRLTSSKKGKPGPQYEIVTQGNPREF